MRKWMGVVLLVVLILMGTILVGVNGLQIGEGYIIVGRGLTVQDKATLTEMVAIGRETAGFYKPYLIVWARDCGV